ncbi:PRC and DUF2382 domain-containing protein [Actinokineospora sp. UTMC 2448]|uniref:PRC and DUF2382 domain-containing protein n=1 Tax=Actinokineospora sp. UTMC 2448 TaxID=2268449 RepID=UPI00216414AE|nr:PRC and DUF2382 domain-containing protein [Actinokineospora sp. UTMC 2448]UVS78879.1 Stress response protein YsnF [Actinokineospora sp. UTMC 2448]
MIDQAQINQLFDCDMVDAHGEKIGSVKQVWLDDRTGRPLWAEVHTGLFGMKDTFVPIQEARMGQGQIVVPVDKKQIKDSPHIDIEGGHMSDAQQDELYRYYGMIPTASTGEHDRLPGGRQQRGTTTRDTATRDTGTRDTSRKGGGITRHEEELHAGVRDVEAGRVRLVKHVVTERQDMSVPVRREEVRVVREPVDPNRPADPNAFGDEEAEVTLHREEAVADKTVRPVEKVRLDKETVTDHERVSGNVRKERIDVEDNTTTRNKRNDRNDRR